MIPFLKNTKYFFTLILVSFFIGCSSDNDNNLPTVEAAFTYFIDGTTGIVEFTNTSTNADSYFWDLGNGNTTTQENPIDRYKTSGEYTVQLIAKNLAGGSDTISQIIEISLPDVPVIETVKLPLDFELDTTNYEITDFDGGNLTIVANPFSNDTNRSTQVGKMIKNDGQTWGGSVIALSQAIDFSTNKTFQMKVYSPRAGAKVLLKVENADDSSISYEIESVTTKANEWETITFNYNDVDASQTYNKVILIFDNGTVGDGSDNFTFYVDDIELVSGGGSGDTTAPIITLVGEATMNLTVGDTFEDPGVTANDDTDGDISASIIVGGDQVNTNTVGTYVITYNVSDAAGNAAAEVTRTVVVTGTSNRPTIGAPTPTHDRANVVSIFGDTYTNITGIDYNPNWGQSGVADANINFDTGNGIVLGYPNFNYQGIDFSGNAQDLSDMEFLHVDVWTPNATALQITPIGGSETLVTLEPLNTGKWNSYDIPLSSFTSVDFTSVIQLKFDGQSGTTPADIYIDNIYFYKTTTGGGAQDNVVSIFSDDYTNIAVNEWGPNWGDSSSRIIEGTLDGSPAKIIKVQANQVFAGIDFSSAAFDATSFTTFHMDYKVDPLLAGQVIVIKLSNHDGGNGETGAIQYTSVPSDTNTVSLAIPLNEFTDASGSGNLSRNAIAQIVITVARADGSQPVDVYLDNIYFSK